MSNQWKDIIKHKKGKLAKCWLAATLSTKTFHRKFKPSTINDINFCQMCDDIKGIIETNNAARYGKSSLYFSSQLVFGAVQIFSYQTSNLEKEITEIEKKLLIAKVNKRDEEKYEKIYDPLIVSSTSSAQLCEDLHLLPDESNIDIILRNKMNDAAWLDFGVLTEEEMSLLIPRDAGISLEMFERMRITNSNMDIGLDMSFEMEKTLPGLEGTDVNMYESQKKMSISPVHDQEHQVAFANRMLPEITIQEIELGKSGLLTPQKRQSHEEKHTETPSKRRRLRFEDAMDTNEVVTASVQVTEAASVSAAVHPSESLQDLESVHEDTLKIGKKSKKVFVDKNKELSHKTIQKWINDVNAHTIPLNIINGNMPPSEVLFKAPATSFAYVHEKKWNNSLHVLFHKHTDTLFNKKRTMHIENKQSLETSTELARFEDRSNKTEGLLPELSAILSKTLESSSHTKSLKETGTTELESSMLQKEWHKEKSTHDSRQEVTIPAIAEEIDIQNVEENLELLHIEQSVYPDIETDEKKKNQEAVDLSESHPLTKQELLAFLEVHWRNAELIRFTDVIVPDNYYKDDAAHCYLLLLVLHREKKITLEQVKPYDTLWIKKYEDDISDDVSMT